MGSGLSHMPLYRKVAVELQAQFGRRYKVGDALPTDRDLARQFGVSLITIRGAMNLLRTDGFISSGRGRSTRVRRAFRVGPVAVLIELDYDHPGSSPFYRNVIAAITAELENQGMPYRLYKGTLQPAARPVELTAGDFEEDMKAGHIGGVIAMGTDPSLRWYREARQAGIPVLGSHREFREAVIFNSFGAVDLGVSRLVEAGCQRIAVLGWEGYRKDNQAARDYFLKTLTGYGIVGYDHWFKFDLHPLAPGSAWEEFREIWTSRREKPDGVFVLDGEMLPGVWQAMRDLKLKVPEDIFVVSKSVNVPETEFFDGVFYLVLDPGELAEEMVAAYRELIKGNFSGHHFVPYRVTSHLTRIQSSPEMKIPHLRNQDSGSVYN